MCVCVGGSVISVISDEHCITVLCHAVFADCIRGRHSIYQGGSGLQL